jgi:hypothetical protein
LLGGTNFVSAVRSSGWPSVPGKVLEAQVEQQSHDDEGERRYWTYTPRVVYSYRVGGVEYRGTRVSFSGPPDYRNPADAQRALHTVGATVEVHFDPAAPGDSSLNARIGTAWFLPVAGLLLLGVAIKLARGLG